MILKQTTTFLISIHALREEGDYCAPAYSKNLLISIHALREEGDVKCLHLRNITKYFYPRPPRGGRRIIISTNPPGLSFLSTPSARRATVVDQIIDIIHLISIHALREEGDPLNRNQMGALLDFYPRPPRGGRPQNLFNLDRDGVISIHALREEGDSRSTRREKAANIFLSTPSARRATNAKRE